MRDEDIEDRGTAITSFATCIWLASEGYEIFGAWWGALAGFVAAMLACASMAILAGWKFPSRASLMGTVGGVALGVEVAGMLGGVRGKEAAILAVEVFGIATAIGIGYTWWSIQAMGGYRYSGVFGAVIMWPTLIAVFLSPASWWKTALGGFVGGCALPLFYGWLFPAHEDYERAYQVKPPPTDPPVAS